MYHKSIILSLLLFFVSSIFMMGFSQNTEKGQRVAVFKNGTGFFFNPMTLKAEKEGEQKGKFIVKSLPDALFGTFWFYTNGKPINSLKSYESDEKSAKKEKATTLHEMLYGNIGENVEITLNSNKESEVTGKIQNVNLQTGMLFLETTKPKVGFMVIAINEIKAISFTKTPNTEFSPTSKKRIIEVEIDKAGAQENVEMAYLQRGIGWLPSYLINLKDDKKAQIILRAELVNDAEDIKDATLSLVVGVPNFKYDKLVSPFVSNQSLEAFLNQLNGNSGNYGRQNMAMSNAIMSQNAGYGGGMEMDAYGGGGNTDEIETQSQEDLFFYTKNGVSLPKGGRALYSLFADEVDYKHIYEVQLAQNNGYNVVYKQDNEQKNDVYHSLELTNSTDFPWTTGTAMVTQPRKTKEGTISATADPQVLSQDMLKYTAKTAKSMLRLTIAPDIMVKDNEQETERETDIKKQKIVYDLVKATATIEVKNYKDKEVTLKVSRTIIGEMLKTDSDWENKKRPNYYAINPVNDVTWELKLAKGESKTITYSYQFYVRK